jgi:ParB family chromosome partitioning protein
MTTPQERRGLGRGLSALLGDANLAPTPDPSARRTGTLDIPIERIHPNPDQPRRAFGEAELEELSRSIAEKGVLQPLILRPHPGQPGAYQIVAGERRWRAAQRARLHALPAVVRDFDDTEVLEVAIIENIQRADLNPIEEAMGYRQLMDRFGHTQEKLAEALGKSRSHIANLLRLLTLPEPVLDLLREGRISAGHARALVVAKAPLALAREIVARGLSVRDIERAVRAESQKDEKNQSPERTKDADTRALEADLSAQLRLKVTIDQRPGANGGSVTIRYGSLEQLDGLCRLLSSK